MLISLVIPMYNEEKKVKSTFSRLERFFSQKTYRVEYVFIEDGSRDSTLSLLKEISKGRNDVKLLINEKNSGKGYSIKRGMLECSGDYALFMDADMSTPLSTFNDFEEYVGKYDIIMGSRWIKESNIRIPQPWHRRMMGRVFYLIIKAFFLKGVSDTNCGFKCYRGRVAKDIFSKQRLRSWGFDVELLYIAQKRNYSIKEIPVVWAHGRDSKVNLLKVPILTIGELLRIKLNDIKGKYA